jgi:polyisoprenoid-binding protein YceI
MASFRSIATLSAYVSTAVFVSGCDEKSQGQAAQGIATTITSAIPTALVSASAAVAAPAAPSPSVAFATIAPGAFDIDMSHSRLGFSIKHMMVSNTRGEFRAFTGTATIDTEDLSKASVALDIDANSIDTHDPKRDAHLKNKDFFETAKFKKITFKSSKIEKSSAGYNVTGDLTIRDQTKSVVLALEPFAAETKDPWGNTRTGTHGTAKIKRGDFGMTWNDPAKIALGEEVTLDLEVELVRKKDATPAPHTSASASAAATGSAKPVIPAAAGSAAAKATK